MLERSRDYLLDFFFGTLRKGVLNSPSVNGGQVADVPRALGKAILSLKTTQAITDDGVDYAAVRASDAYQHVQNNIYPCLAEFDPESLKSVEEQKTFWINLYNLLTIDAVLRFAVKDSVTEGWFGAIRFFRRAAYCINGYRFSLEDIEHGILRANRGVPFFPGKHFGKGDPRLHYALTEVDARIHFALNCASKSCAPIAYYSADRVDAHLDLAAANHIERSTRMDKSGVVLHVSKLFKWYQRDFGGWDGVLEMIGTYLPESDMRRRLIENFGEKTMILYDPYDWRLNVLTYNKV